MKDVAVIIPAYKYQPSGTEILSFRICCNQLKDYPVILVKPRGLKTEKYSEWFRDFSEEEFDSHFFSGLEGYNQLLMSREFYARFENYKYILICQLDVILFKNDIENWVAKSYDYIGAPWLDYKIDIFFNILVKMSPGKALQLLFSGAINKPVGNGGLSLRKVDTFIKAAEENQKIIRNWKTNEDYFWSFFGRINGKRLKIPDVDEAVEFSIERKPLKAFSMLKSKFPLGIHGWNKMDRNFIQHKLEETKLMEYVFKKNLFPKVTVITVNYNQCFLLEKTIKNIFNQKYDDLEFIVVDGGSDDGSLAVIEKNEDRIARWISDKDNGIYDAMNKGLKIATGDYVWFINSGDEIFDSTTLEQVFTENESGDIYYGNTMIVNIREEELGSRRLSPPEKLSWRSFQLGQRVSHQAFIVKRELAPLYDLKYPHSADIDWQINCMKNSNSIINTRRYLCRYLEGGRSSKTILPSLRERFLIMVKNYGLIKTLLNHLVIIVRFIFQVTRLGRFILFL